VKQDIAAVQTAVCDKLQQHVNKLQMQLTKIQDLLLSAKIPDGSAHHATNTGLIPVPVMRSSAGQCNDASSTDIVLDTVHSSGAMLEKCRNQAECEQPCTAHQDGQLTAQRCVDTMAWQHVSLAGSIGQDAGACAPQRHCRSDSAQAFLSQRPCNRQKAMKRTSPAWIRQLKSQLRASRHAIMAAQQEWLAAAARVKALPHGQHKASLGIMLQEVCVHARSRLGWGSAVKYKQVRADVFSAGICVKK
jgi:hypothetical protein